MKPSCVRDGQRKRAGQIDVEINMVREGDNDTEQLDGQRT